MQRNLSATCKTAAILSIRKNRLQLLKYRLASLQALDRYLREKNNDKPMTIMPKTMSLFHDNPMLITASAMPPAIPKHRNGMMKQNTYLGMGSGYTMEMINATKFNDPKKIDELRGGGFIYGIPEYTQLNVTIPKYDKDYKDMYLVEVLDGYLKGVKGYVGQDTVWLY